MARALLQTFAHSHMLFQHTLRSYMQSASIVRALLVRTDPDERVLLRSEKTLHEQ